MVRHLLIPLIDSTDGKSSGLNVQGVATSFLGLIVNITIMDAITTTGITISKPVNISVIPPRLILLMSVKELTYVLNSLADMDRFISTVLSDFSGKYQPEIHEEVELRFGYFEKGRFTPGVSRSEFFHLKGVLEESDEYKSWKEITTDEYYKSGRLRYRKTGEKCIIKNRLLKEDIPEMFLRCSFATEEEIKPLRKGKLENKRFKERWIFQGNNHEIHLTFVDKSSFEVEIELETVLLKTEKAVEDLFLKIYQEMKQTDILYWKSEADALFTYLNSLTSEGRHSRPLRIEYDFFPHPINLRWIDLQMMFKEVEYFSSSKADGYNWFLVFWKGYMYFMNTAGIINKISESPSEFDKSVFQGEVIPDKNLKYKTDMKYSYFVFDCLSFKGKSVVKEKYEERIERIKEMEKTFSSDLLDFRLKPVMKVNKDTFHADNNVLVNNPMFVTDGIIFTPNLRYFLTNRQIRTLPKRKPDNHVIRKWKPPEQLTIDFRIIRENGEFVLMSAKDEVFRGSDMASFDSKRDLEVNEILQESNHRDIIEFEYKNNKLVPIRHREDKIVPNGRSVALNVWDDIHDPISVNLMTNPHNVEMSKRLISFVKTQVLERMTSEKNSLLVVGPPFQTKREYDVVRLEECKYSKIKERLTELGRLSRFWNIVLQTTNNKCIEKVYKKLKNSKGVMIVFGNEGEPIKYDDSVVLTEEDKENLKMRWKVLN